MLDIPLRTATVAHDLQSVAERLVAIHPTAIVKAGAQLGHGVQIGPFCHVGADVRLNENVRLASPVVVAGDTVVGEGAVLSPFCTVGLAPQDLKYKGEPTR